MTQVNSNGELAKATRLLGRRDWITLVGLAMGTAGLYLWNLTASGWANSFYAAAVQAGSKSWKAFFFGSFDASNAITVDKPPAALWPMELSARLFGFSSFSMLLPEVLMGVASVILLFLLLRKRFGWGAGLLGAITLALTPVAALMFRFNNPDALLVLLMLASIGGTFKLNDTGKRRWAILIGAVLGLAFLVKSFQAFLILPTLAIPYLLFGRPKLGRRLIDLVVALAALVVAGGWWLLIVELWPAAERPYIGGSQTNSALELILGYNGFGRLTGNETGSVGGGGNGGGSMWGATGIFRLFLADFGGQIAWLLPLALVALVGALILFWRTRLVKPHFLQTAVWGSSLLATGLTFSFMQGIFHQYYTIALAPYVAALVGIFASVLWYYRSRWYVRAVAGVAVAGSAVWAALLLTRGASPAWLIPTILITGVLAAIGLQLINTRGKLFKSAVAFLTVFSLLAGPSYYTLYTVLTAHTGSIVTAGPRVASASGMGGMGRGGEGFAGRGGPGGGANTQQNGAGSTGGNPPAGMIQGGGTMPNGTNGPGAQGGAPTGAMMGEGMGGGAGGLLNASTPSTAVIKLLKTDASKYDWVLAVSGSQQAAGYQLGSDEPVMSMGGFNGTDPYPTLALFKQYVKAGRIHYYLASSGSGMGGSSNTSSAITTWVKAHYNTVKVGSTTFYDLTSPIS